MGDGLIVRRGGGIPADPDLIPENIRKGVEIYGVTGALIEGSNMSKGIVDVSASAGESETFTTGLRIAHGLGVIPSYVSLNMTGDMKPNNWANSSSVYNFKSYVTGCLEWLYTFPATNGGNADFEGRGYYGSDTFTHLRVRIDTSYIYIDHLHKWNASGSYRTVGVIPSGTLHWVAVA